MMTVTEMLEKAFEDGRANLVVMNDRALLRSYKRFKYNKIIGQALLQEMRRRGNFRIVEEIDELVERMRRIREQVRENPDSRGRWWNEYKKAKEKLLELDPYNVELDIGIFGKPFGSGLADQS